MIGRITFELVRQGTFSPLHFGFRAGRGTVLAVKQLVDIIRQSRKDGFFDVGLSWDICEALNSAEWSLVNEAFRRKRITEGLRCML